MATKPTTPDRSDYMAEYYRKRRDDLRRQRHQKYLENRDERIAGVQQAKKSGKKPASAENAVPVRRRWLVIGDRVYFNSRLGVSRSEMDTVISDLRRSIELQKDDPEEFSKNSTRQRKHLNYLANRSTSVARMNEYREKVIGSTPRKEAPVGERITVSKRRWLVIGHRLYFNPKVELTMQDVRQALSDLRRTITRPSCREKNPHFVRVIP